MPRFTITTEHVFAASHAIRLGDDDLEPLHGHNWPVCVTIGSNHLDALDCVMDFHQLHSLVEAVLAPWHNTHLNNQPPFSDGRGGLAINPTAERIVQHIATAVEAKLPEHIVLVRVTLGEAPGCTAAYTP